MYNTNKPNYNNYKILKQNYNNIVKPLNNLL